MKKKGDMTNETVVYSLLALLIIFFVSAFGYYVYKNIFAVSNKSIIQAWVDEKFAQESITKGFLPSSVSVGPDRPPIPELEEPYIINSESQLQWKGSKPPEVFTETANTMVECWQAFGSGKKDFMNKINRDVFCYPCRQIAIDDKLKEKFGSVKGFKVFLHNYGPKGVDDKNKYDKLIANNPDFEETDFSDDELILQNNLYIYFVGFSGRGIVDLLGGATGFSEGAGTGLVRTGSAAVALPIAKLLIVKVGFKLVLGPAGWAVTAYDAGQGLKKVVIGDKNFVATVGVVDAEKINSICNEKQEGEVESLVA